MSKQHHAKHVHGATERRVSQLQKAWIIINFDFYRTGLWKMQSSQSSQFPKQNNPAKGVVWAVPFCHEIVLIQATREYWHREGETHIKNRRKKTVNNWVTAGCHKQNNEICLWLRIDYTINVDKTTSCRLASVRPSSTVSSLAAK